MMRRTMQEIKDVVQALRKHAIRKVLEHFPAGIFISSHDALQEGRVQQTHDPSPKNL